MVSTNIAPPIIRPQVDFPPDPGLVELPKLFDANWIWGKFQSEFGEQGHTPETIRVRHFIHSVGRMAMASYLLEYNQEAYLPSQHLTIKTERGQDTDFCRYPEDERLPALAKVADPETAVKLVNEHVLAMRPRRVRVQLVRYRPRSRAVFRHIAGRVKLYARVVRPATVTGMLAAHQLIGETDFVVPRIVGCWNEGGVLWFSEIPGKNLRRQILKGRMPDVEPMLAGLESLWARPIESGKGQSLDLHRAYRAARRTFRNKIGEDTEARREFYQAVEALDPFVRSWRPTHIAHNDFYDDQMIQLADGRIALVDFEEAGPGDPMLDVGNCLAHLKWAAHFGSKRKNRANAAFYEAFKTSALERFRWEPSQLALREAVCLFRVCTNTIRHPRPNWKDNLERGLSFVNQTLP